MTVADFQSSEVQTDVQETIGIYVKLSRKDVHDGGVYDSKGEEKEEEERKGRDNVNI